MSDSFDQLTDTWIAEHRNYRNQERPTIGWAFVELNRMCREEPFAALRVIEQILAKDTSDPIMEMLAAGPLENILVMHGSIVLDEVRKLAKSNTSFKDLLGGVRNAGIDPQVWEQVENLDRRSGRNADVEQVRAATWPRQQCRR